MKKKIGLDRAARQLADLLERHLGELSPSEREAKSRAFHEAVAEIGIQEPGVSSLEIEE